MNIEKEILGRAVEVVFQRTVRKDYMPQTLANDLFLESLLYCSPAFGRPAYQEYVLSTISGREKQGTVRFSRKQFYTCLPYNLWISTGEEKHLEGLVRFAAELRDSIGRDKDGAVVAPDDGRKCRISVLVLQGYATCMARTGAITGDTGWFDEAVNQFGIYRKVLRNEQTGLWHHGRGWADDPLFLSPGYWNQAQALCLRGISEVLDCFPPSYPGYEKMVSMLHETALSLLPFQGKDGMWHQLTNAPDSYPETGGTALLAFYLLKGVKKKWLPEQPFTDAALKAVTAVLKYLNRDGSVSNVSYFTDPLRTEEGYRHLPAFSGDTQGAAYFLMACSAPFLPS